MLSIEAVTKSYNHKKALENFDLMVESGSVAAIIGPNGAGKSTLFNVLAGIIEANSGKVSLNGSDFFRAPLNKVGFLPETQFFYPRFTAREALFYDMTMRDIPQNKSNWEKIAATFSFLDFLDVRLELLSQGMKKRVALGCAFLGEPDVIILDEPLNSLDIQTVIALKESITTEKQRGAHILLSSHVLSFLDGLADTLVFIKNGSVIGACKGESEQAEDIYKRLFMLETE